jgi:hypothetical protein
MGSVLVIRQKVRGLITAEGDGFLRGITIRSTPSFGGEVKSWSHVVIFYGMLKSLRSENKYTSKSKFIISFAQFLLICY